MNADPYLKATEHCILLISHEQKVWVDDDICETGQLNKSNNDKAIASDICHKVEAINDKAYADARAKLRPWYEFWKR